MADQHGNRKWDLGDKNQIADIISKIYIATDNTIIHLPFDQSAGLLLRLLNKKAIRDDFRSIFSFPDQRITPLFPYACVHIRRGDCSRNKHPLWHVEDNFYIQLLQLLFSTLPSEYKVYVCTQGDIGWLNTSELSHALTSQRLIIRSTDQLFINDSEIDDFIIIKNASLLCSAASSFSHWASYLGCHHLVVDISRTGFHAFNNTLIVNPDDSVVDNMSKISKAVDMLEFTPFMYRNIHQLSQW